jgi:hypothetical protein
MYKIINRATKTTFMDDKNGGSIVQIDVFFFQADALFVLIYSVGKVISVAIHKWVSGCKACKISSTFYCFGRVSIKI